MTAVCVCGPTCIHIFLFFFFCTVCVRGQQPPPGGQKVGKKEKEGEEPKDDGVRKETRTQWPSQLPSRRPAKRTPPPLEKKITERLLLLFHSPVCQRLSTRQQHFFVVCTFLSSCPLPTTPKCQPQTLFSDLVSVCEKSLHVSLSHSFVVKTPTTVRAGRWPFHSQNLLLLNI